MLGVKGRVREEGGVLGLGLGFLPLGLGSRPLTPSDPGPFFPFVQS